MNFQLFAENLHAKFQKVEGRKCITYIVLHPISVKPNKSQQFHEKMYTIQELNYYICSNLCMSFSKKSQVFFASLLVDGETRDV